MNNEVATTQQAEEAYKSGSMQYMDSREVAEIVEKEHKNLLRDIKRYSGELAKLNFEPTDFFVESSYKDASGKINKSYLVTKKGCEFIAHKLTGIKGTQFTATYINRFHQMEDTIKSGELAQIAGLSKQVAEMQELVNSQQKMLEDLLHQRGKSSKRISKNPYKTAEEIELEERKIELYDLTGEVASLCSISHTTILHQLYCAIEDIAKVTLDAYKSVYISETGKKNAGMVEVIAANEKLYKLAVKLNEAVIKKHKEQ